MGSTLGTMDGPIGAISKTISEMGLVSYSIAKIDYTTKEGGSMEIKWVRNSLDIKNMNKNIVILN